jgi:two-component system cell cycle sensor histidine kinase/response regulator CckA
MPSGGRLTIATTNAIRDDHSPCVRLTVADSGAGMPPEVLARAFEPFFTTRAEQGTGLGLATVYGIITQAGGTASLESELGVGTTFSAQIPVAAEVPAVMAPPEAFEPAAGPGTVLVIDDEPGIRDVAERILLRHGYDVIIATDADEARSFVVRHIGVIDLVLSDVIMPGCNGPELIDQLREVRPDLRVLFMSGYTGTELATRSSMGDEYTLLEKPFSEATLIEAIDGVLKR